VPGLFKENKEGLELNVYIQLPVYADDVHNMLREKINTMMNNRKSLQARK
jgi:hypothetical protein